MSTNNKERKIAKKAQRKLQASFDSEFDNFKNHYQGKRDAQNKPLADSKIKYRGRNWTSPQGDRIYYLNKIVIKMPKHGFVQHYGVDDRLRAAHKVNRERPRPITYNRKEHYYDLPAHEFIDTALENSGVVEMIAKEISEIRGYDVLTRMLNKMVDRINQQQPKK